jgi:acetoacetyl-CoA synthetase
MAALLEQPTLPRLTPFLQVKAGNEKPPIFITHGLCGTVQFFKLAKHIRTGHPIYGIQAKGINGSEEPFDRVEDMAEYYLNALEESHPDDRYILIGYSFGGLVALEVAQRLAAKGRPVALLVLLDAFPHPRFMPAPWRVRYL